MDFKEIRKKNFLSVIKDKKTYVFGAGICSKRLLVYLGDELLKYIRGIVVSEKKSNPNMLGGINVIGIESIVPDDDILIIVAVYDNIRIIAQLNDLGFKNCIPIERVMPINNSNDFRLMRNAEIERYIHFFEKEAPLFRYIEIE